jgi:ankyrin repeat protein
MQLLLNHNWNMNKMDAEGQTPLHLAAKNGDQSVVRALLNHTDVNLHAQD